ncbi:hypothetical protein R69608_06857 [Paraburkholderia nemoris]|nr:hypothetical protein R69608_06857 [Paraburkholderia nemoris]
MEPGQLCSRLLHKFRARPSLRQRAHIFQVARGKTAHVGKRCFQVPGKLVNYSGAPPLPLLTIQNFPANLPVESHEFAVRAGDCAKSGSLDSLLEFSEPAPVVFTP